ncbi:P-loop containing nucleoside triphosphate hydrolase protein [Trichoderma asperelloides]|nr:P-loop containing nucleoside triphosphate hydrolase protein [Trichoderma asperelloides]
MEPQVQKLVDKVWKSYLNTPQDHRLLIGIGGIPGSGKTTLAQTISYKLNALANAYAPNAPPPAIFVPMDGFHLTRAELSAMPDPVTAHARRGAPYTFDARKFHALVQSLRRPISPSETIYAPSFDHAIKDPKENDIAVGPTHRIVVIEGNYVALNKEVWRDAALLFDELWFVEVDFEVARKRLRERHVRAGIVQTIEEGDKRATENDLVNGKEIVDYSLQVHELVQSREDGSWVHE